MFRIDTHPSGSVRVDVSLSGRLTDVEVPQLAAALEPHVSGRKSVHLDLSAVTGLDHDAVALLLSLASSGVRLAHCPPFLTLWLRAEERSRNRGPSRIRDATAHESAPNAHRSANTGPR